MKEMLALKVSERDFAAERLPLIPLPPPVRIPKHGYHESIASLASTVSTVSASSRFSAESFAASPRSSVTSCGSFEFGAPPTLVKTPWELQRSKRHPDPALSRTRPHSAKSLSPRIFAKLPQEVYRCILQQLEHDYFRAEAGGCVTCYLHDLFSLSLTSRSWNRATKLHLYGRIWLPVDEMANFKKLKGDSVHRIKLLRRTLNERPSLATLVKELQMPGMQVAYGKADTKERQAIIDIAAWLIMLCPKLERFAGLVLSYDHCDDKLTYALSTRTKLKERVWSLKRADVVEDEAGEATIVRKKLSGFNVENPDAFLKCHDNWPFLRSMLLFGQGVGSMDYRSFAATFRSLPSLRHLLISNFDNVEFNDRTLASIPPNLISLRLQGLPGVTDKGLLKLATSPSSTSLKSLSLIHLDLTSAMLLRHLFCLPVLQRFTIVQDTSPSLPLGVDLPAPLYRSPNLEFLHWDIYDVGAANVDLATSMLHHGTFPKLRAIRAPNDHHGLLQGLCKPTGDVLLPTDLQLVRQIDLDAKPPGKLTLARRAAQRRVDEARLRPLMQIVVQEDDLIRHRYTLRNFMGRLDSKISYVLTPDVPGSDEPIAGLADFVQLGAIGKDDDFGVWCSGRAWADGRTGAEAKKGRTHARRRKARVEDLSMMF